MAIKALWIKLIITGEIVQIAFIGTDRFECTWPFWVQISKKASLLNCTLSIIKVLSSDYLGLLTWRFE